MRNRKNITTILTDMANKTDHGIGSFFKLSQFMCENANIMAISVTFPCILIFHPSDAQKNRSTKI